MSNRITIRKNIVTGQGCRQNDTPDQLLDEILRIRESGFGELLIAKNGDSRVGMTFILKGEGLIYIYNLAVDPRMRGLGYGSSVLDGLKAMFPGCRFALSSESPDPDARNLEERLRRISFYERNGFADSRRRDMWGERGTPS